MPNIIGPRQNPEIDLYIHLIINQRAKSPNGKRNVFLGTISGKLNILIKEKKGAI